MGCKAQSLSVPVVSRAFATPQTAQTQDAPATTGLFRGSLVAFMPENGFRVEKTTHNREGLI